MRFEILNGGVTQTISNALSHGMLKRVMCLCSGPVSYYGHQLTHHYANNDKIASKLAGRDFESFQFHEFWERLALPNHLGLLVYCGHGYKSGGGEAWLVSDIQFTQLCKTVHEDSRLFVVMDCCFSDGMLDAELDNVAMLSAARSYGEHSSAFYTGDGGFMSWSYMKMCNHETLSARAIREELVSAWYHSDITQEEAPRLIGGEGVYFP